MAVPSFGFLEPGKTPSDKVPSPDTPFRIALLGDFSGRASRGEQRDAEALAKLKPVAVSRDTLEDVMARLKVTIKLPLPDDEELTLPFQSLDDLNPDEFYDRVEKFEDLDDDDEKSMLLRSLLHHAAFQELEAGWLGLDWLLKRVHKKNSGIEVTLLDLTLAELRADLLAGDDLSKTGLYRSLLAPVIESGKAQPWALLVGHFSFTPTPEDIGLLGRLTRFAGVAAAPFVTAAAPLVLDNDFALDDDAAAAWGALRKLPEAALLGLATPRILMRLPYGENTKSIDKFSFEELEPAEGKAGYLWMNPAFGVACLLGLSFHKESWGFKSGAVLDLDDLPMHVWKDQDGDDQVTVAEAWLERKTVERLIKLGLMPFLSVRGKNALQLSRFASLAEPPKGQPATDLVGRWGQKGALKVPRAVGRPGGVSMNLVGGAAPEAPPESEAPAEAEAESPAEEISDAPSEEAAVDETPAAPAAEEEMDPELAALLKQMESPAAEAPPAEEAAPAEEMDPELAALLKQIEGGDSAEAAPAPAADAPAEEMDPELAALLQQIEGGDTAEAAPAAAAEAPAAEAPASEETDPELAALLNQLESTEASAEAPAPAEAAPEATPAETPPAEEIDPELAALLQQVEGGDTAAEAPPEPAPPPAEPEPAAEEMDPELAALLQQLDGGEAEAPAAPEKPAPKAPPAAQAPAAPAPPAATAPPAPKAPAPPAPPATPVDPELLEEFESLGGADALTALGWPAFAPAFVADLKKMIRYLRKDTKNKPVEKEVADLVKKCGGYDTVKNDGVRPDMPVGQQLTKLRDIKKMVDVDKFLRDEDVLAMAEAYGANLKKVTNLKAKGELLAQVKDYDKWARDARNTDAAAALDGLPFKERRQAQLEQQLESLGGDKAFTALQANHPRDLTAKSSLDDKIAALRADKEYTKLGGDATFVKKVGNDPKTTSLVAKLEQLKAVQAASE
jgi:predicted component of type VI protein secretion system